MGVSCWDFGIKNNMHSLYIRMPQKSKKAYTCLSTTLNKNIALCRIDTQYSEPGTEVEVGKIDGHQKRISAKVVGFPHFDPKKTRVRS